jgi:diguanylate cyclase (GGDEF)-like protein
VEGNHLGVLHIGQAVGTLDALHEQHVAVATMAADLIGLALSNIHLREHLREQSLRDVLTGLSNRRYLDETLPRELQRAKRREHIVSIILLDIDHFKWFNDTYGHDAGDTLLQAIGAFLHQSLRGEDIVCRYGGEEFILVLPGASLEHTRRRAEELRLGVQTLTVEHNGQPLEQVTISLGVAAFPYHGRTADAVIKAADEAL